MATTSLRRTIGSLVIALATTAALPASTSTSVMPAGAVEGTFQSPRAATPEPLFTQVASASTAQSSEMAKHTIRRATLTVSDKAIAAGAILSAEAHLFNLFPDVQIVAVRNRIESRSTRSYSWFGNIPGDEFGRAIVTVVDGTLGALVTTKGKRYLVRPTGDGRHEVLDLDEESFPEGDDTAPGSPPTRRAGTTRSGMARATAPTGLTTLDAGGITMRAVDKRFVEGN